MSGSCGFDGCTVDATGVCALERDSLSCGNRVGNKQVTASSTDSDSNSEVVSQSVDILGAPVLEPPVRTSAFSSSRTLGLEYLNAMMGRRYVNVVGILGDPESGKTACLASLYLLVSHAMLEGWAFANSRSLAAFEEIARGARDWNDGRAPEQMTVHTELADDDEPGFLHLRLVRLADGRRIDLALPDMPGEWTQELVTSARSDRLDFIKSAEAIWIVLDGRMLTDVEKRHGLIARAGQLTGRLNTMLEGRLPRLMVVVTHCDLYTCSDKVISLLQKEFTKRGAVAEIVSVAPFSDNPDNVPAGYGIARLIDLTAGKQTERPTFWKQTETREDRRAYLNYRRER